MNRLTILLIAASERPEFAAARADLAELGALTVAADVPSARRIVSASPTLPDLIVLAQAYPGEHSDVELHALRCLAPMARVVVLLGSWCEGETRTGTPLPGVVRVYWHQWPVRGRREVAQLARGASCAWALPVTAGEEDRLLADAAVRSVGAGLALVYTHEDPQADWLLTAFRQAGYTARHIRTAAAARDAQPAAVVFDAAELGPAEQAELRLLAETTQRAPIVVLLQFPRLDDQERARAAGARAVRAKPVLVDELLAEFAGSVAPAPNSVGVSLAQSAGER